MSDIATANSLIDKAYSNYYVYDTFNAGQLVGVTLTYINSGKIGVGYHVLSQLQKRNFASSDIVHVARGILDGIPDTKLNAIIRQADGLMLVKIIGSILKYNAKGNENAARSLKLKSAFNSLKPKDETPQPRKLTDAEMDYFVNYNGKDLVFYERDGSGKLRSTGGRRNTFDKDICWKLPERSPFYEIYNLDDLKGVPSLKDTYGFDQIGTKETIDAMISIAKAWSKTNTKIQYGDVSRPGGVNTPDHKTHNVGKAWDMRLFRKDKAMANLKLNAGTSDDAQFDRETTAEYIRLAIKLFPETTVYFNDKTLIKDFKGVIESKPGHWDHLHVMPYRKGRE